MKIKILPITIYRVRILFKVLASFGQASWKVATSTNRATATNRFAGIPLATTDVIGDANFTGCISAISSVSVKSLIPLLCIATTKAYFKNFPNTCKPESHKKNIHINLLCQPGQVMISQHINHSEHSTSERIQLDKYSVPGIYQPVTKTWPK